MPTAARPLPPHPCMPIALPLAAAPCYSRPPPPAAARHAPLALCGGGKRDAPHHSHRRMRFSCSSSKQTAGPAVHGATAAPAPNSATSHIFDICFARSVAATTASMNAARTPACGRSRFAHESVRAQRLSNCPRFDPRDTRVCSTHSAQRSAERAPFRARGFQRWLCPQETPPGPSARPGAAAAVEVGEVSARAVTRRGVLRAFSSGRADKANRLASLPGSGRLASPARAA